jgi:hypothetical protein
VIFFNSNKLLWICSLQCHHQHLTLLKIIVIHLKIVKQFLYIFSLPVKSLNPKKILVCGKKKIKAKINAISHKLHSKHGGITKTLLLELWEWGRQNRFIFNGATIELMYYAKQLLSLFNVTRHFTTEDGLVNRKYFPVHKNWGFTLFSITKNKIDLLNIYLGRLCHHQELQLNEYS